MSQTRHTVAQMIGAVKQMGRGRPQRSAQGARAVGNFWGRVVVNGRVVEYRAAKLANGSINVGTYYVIP